MFNFVNFNERYFPLTISFIVLQIIITYRYTKVVSVNFLRVRLLRFDLSVFAIQGPDAEVFVTTSDEHIVIGIAVFETCHIASARKSGICPTNRF